MNGIGTCRTMSIGGAAAGGVLLWILLALGERGWFSSLLIAALIAGAAAALLLALVCRDQDPASSETAAPPAGDAPSAEAVDAPGAGIAADTGGRRAESATPEARPHVNDTAVLEDRPEEGAPSADPEAGDLGEEVAQARSLDRDAAGEEPELRAEAEAGAEMPDGVAAELRNKPELLEAPRGTADDLKRLRGVGPKLEEQLNRIGVWHIDQIASWSDAEAAWIDDHLEGFKGRIQRDDWIGQARTLRDTDA